MNSSFDFAFIKPIHPFPARMATSLVWDNLPQKGTPLKILDPMAGSGTTLVIASAQGHNAVGCDTDPLAVIIARAWCAKMDSKKLRGFADMVFEEAKKNSKYITHDLAYPTNIDSESKAFLNFWFDEESRIQLTSLSNSINSCNNSIYRNLLWTAFSRLIITKKIGVSLAMDVSHGRPHRTYSDSPVLPFDKFSHAVDYIIQKSPFRDCGDQIKPAYIINGDARSLSFERNSYDLVITSPPYLNAIDYIRGHKLTLVWMGHSIKNLRRIRNNNIGTEDAHLFISDKEILESIEVMGKVNDLPPRTRNILIKYAYDMRKTLSECSRVLKPNGQAIFVIGNSTLKGNPILNSELLILLSKNQNLKLISQEKRPLPELKRYLPPPNLVVSENSLNNRMREEVVLRFCKV